MKERFTLENMYKKCMYVTSMQNIHVCIRLYAAARRVKGKNVKKKILDSKGLQYTAKK